ncbi:MAG: ATPase domain-containing protein [Acidobacteriota bacterium]
MSSITQRKIQLEALVSGKIPEAFQPRKATYTQRILTGIPALDTAIGGFPRGGLTEICGEPSSGRTALAMSVLAEATHRQEYCALVDVSDSLDPESCSQAGVDLEHLLWVRCGLLSSDAPYRDENSAHVGVAPPKNRRISKRRGVSHEGGLSRHPRNESRNLGTAITHLWAETRQQTLHEEKSPKRSDSERIAAQTGPLPSPSVHLEEKHALDSCRVVVPASPWERLAQALKVMDLLLQGGGFGLVVVDMAGLPVDKVQRIPLAWWFRFRTAVENTSTALLCLTRTPCTNTSASLLLRCERHQEVWTAVSKAKSGNHQATLERLKLRVKVVRDRTENESSHRSHAVSWQTRMPWSLSSEFSLGSPVRSVEKSN